MPANFTGVWHFDRTRSKLLAPLPETIEVRITHSGSDLRQEIVITKPDGSQDRQVFTCRTTGEPGQCQLSGKPLRGTARWEGEELMIETWIERGPRELHFRDCWWLSPDGQTLFMEHRDDDLAGQRAVLKKMR